MSDNSKNYEFFKLSDNSKNYEFFKLSDNSKNYEFFKLSDNSKNYANYLTVKQDVTSPTGRYQLAPGALTQPGALFGFKR